MKIEKTPLEDHQLQLLVEIDTETFDQSKQRASRKLSRTHKIPGFRPGKAPYHMVARHLGEGAIVEEAVEHLVDEIYPKLIEEHDIAAYGPGQLKEIKELNPPQFEFVIPLAPTVTLGDYHAIRREYALPEIDEKDIERTLNGLRDDRAKATPVERAAEPGDLLAVSIEGRDAAANAEDEPLINMARTPVIIKPVEADTSVERPFPGFSNQLAGASKDEVRNMEFTFPADHSAANMAGKTVHFKVAVLEISARELPLLDDEFAISLGEYENLEALRLDARKHLEAQTKTDYDDHFMNGLLDEAVEQSEIHYPPQMVEEEINTLVDQLNNRLAREGWNLEMYLSVNNKDQASLREEFRETAIRRIRRGLVLMELASAEKIAVSEHDVEGEVLRTVEMVQGSMDAREARKLLTQDTIRGLVVGAMRDSMTEKTLARLKAIATGVSEETEAEPETHGAAETPEDTAPPETPDAPLDEPI